MTTARDDGPSVDERITANVTAALKDDERTPAWLARRANIKRTTLLYWLKTHRYPVHGLLAIADALGRNPEDLYADPATAPASMGEAAA